MAWMMCGGWREDVNEGPYDFLAVRDGWEIFCSNTSRDKYRVTAPDGSVTKHSTEKEAKEHAYLNGCSTPEKEKTK